MAKANTRHLSEEELAPLREAFSLFDKNGDGTISTTELGEVMRSLQLSPSEAELNDLINEVDVDGNGSIDFDEFAQLMSQKLTTPVSVTEELRAAFNVFDRDCSGTISLAELKAVMGNIDNKATAAEIEDMLRQADEDGNGTIDFNEFVKLMSEPEKK